jgi:hypothetical protein
MNVLIAAGLAAAFALLPAAGQAAPLKKHHRVAPRGAQPLPAPAPLNDARGNAALGGNNANSAFGSNSANENANGRTGGGFGN